MSDAMLKELKERRSIRNYKPDMVPDSLIEQVIEAGLYAASSCNDQDAVIVAVTNRELRDRLAEVNRQVGGFPEDMDPFYGAPVVLIVLGNKNSTTAVHDGSLIMGNLMQAAHAVGLGSCWIHRAKDEFEMEEFKAILKELGAEGEYVGVGHCILGYVDGEYPKAPERKPNRVFWYR